MKIILYMQKFTFINVLLTIMLSIFFVNEVFSKEVQNLKEIIIYQKNRTICLTKQRKKFYIYFVSEGLDGLNTLALKKNSSLKINLSKKYQLYEDVDNGTFYFNNLKIIINNFTENKFKVKVEYRNEINNLVAMVTDGNVVLSKSIKSKNENVAELSISDKFNEKKTNFQCINKEFKENIIEVFYDVNNYWRYLKNKEAIINPIKGSRFIYYKNTKCDPSSFKIKNSVSDIDMEATTRCKNDYKKNYICDLIEDLYFYSSHNIMNKKIVIFGSTDIYCKKNKYEIAKNYLKQNPMIIKNKNIIELKCMDKSNK